MDNTEKMSRAACLAAGKDPDGITHESSISTTFEWHHYIGIALAVRNSIFESLSET